MVKIEFEEGSEYKWAVNSIIAITKTNSRTKIKIKISSGELIQGINYIQIGETEIDNIISDIETPPFGLSLIHI